MFHSDLEPLSRQLFLYVWYFYFRGTKLNLVSKVIFAEHVYLVNYKRYPDNIHTHYINKSLWNKTKLNNTNCFHRLKISYWWTNCVVYRCLYLKNILPFHYNYLIRNSVCVFFLYVCNIITRNESFNRKTLFSYKPTIEMLQMPHFVAMQRILRKFYRRIYINNGSILNFTLIGYYLHYVNSSPAELKTIPFRFWENETKLIPPTCKISHASPFAVILFV